MVPRSGKQRIFAFGSFRVDTSERMLFRGDEPIQLQPKTFDLLLMLVENHGRVLEKDQLLGAIWPEAVVEESNLSQNVYLLRKVFGCDPGGAKYIETVPKRGYRFAVDVNEVSDGAGALTTTDGGTAAESRALSHRNKGLLAALSLIICGLAAASVVLYRSATVKPSSAAQDVGDQREPFQRMKIRRITDTGKVVHPAISPDGKYIAYTLTDSGQYSLWIQQVDTGSATQITAPTDAMLFSAVFSHSGNYVFYERQEKGVATVYQLPVLGGVPRKIASNVWSGVAISPDDKRIAFVRLDSTNSESVLVAATINSGEEQRITARKSPEYLEMWNCGPAWSPNGNSLVCVAGAPEGQVLIEAFEGGAENRLGNTTWTEVGSVAWLADATGLIVTADTDAGSSPQVWNVSYPAGEVRRVTNDLNRYNRISVTSDGRMLLAERSENVSHIWVLPEEDERRAKQLTFGISSQDGAHGLCWGPRGNIVYSAEQDGRFDLWRIDANGKNQVQLTLNAGRWNAQPCISPDGSHIAFVSDRTGYRNIWVMDIDGQNAKQFTFGKGEMNPSYTVEGEWIIYSDWASPKASIKKVSAAGGDAIDVGLETSRANLSPDGSFVAYYVYNGQSERPWQTIVTAVGASEPIATFYDFYRGLCRWTRDGKGLTYIDLKDSYNVWVQPIDGNPPRRLTRFMSGYTNWLDWSPDGKSLAIARGDFRTDAVLLTDFR